VGLVDYVCLTGTHDGRVIEYSDHLHEHVCDPVVMRGGRYMPPEAAGYSVKFTEAALQGFVHRA
jgi:L-fuconate dehydratase